MDQRRRRVLAGCGAAILGLAGCLGEPDGNAGTRTTPPTDTAPEDRDTRSATPPEGSTTSAEPPDEGRTPSGPRRTAWHVPTTLTPQRPLVVDGTCYLGTGSYDEGTAAAALMAVAPDGTVNWRRDTGQLTARVAAVADGLVYAVSGDRTSEGLHGKAYRVHAIDATSGTRRWVWAPEKRYKFFELVGVSDGTVFVGTHDDNLQEDGEQLHAVADGRSQWETSLGDVMDGTVVGDTVVAVDPLTATGFDASDGRERWTVETTAYGGLDVGTVGDLVLTGDERLAALDARTGETQWTYGDGDVSVWVDRDDRVFVGGTAVVALDRTGVTQWTYDQAGVPSGVVTGDAVAGFHDQTLFLLDRETGEERWRVAVDTEFPSPSGVAGEVLAYGTRDGVAAVDVASGAPAWSWESSQRLLHPVVADGRVVVGRDGGGLWALEP